MSFKAHSDLCTFSYFIFFRATLAWLSFMRDDIDSRKFTLSCTSRRRKHDAPTSPLPPCQFTVFAWGASKGQAALAKKLKIMMKSAWGPDDPTRAAFPFAHGLVLAEAGHDVQIFLLAEATSLLRKSMVTAIFPVGWPPLSETLDKVVAKHIPVFA